MKRDFPVSLREFGIDNQTLLAGFDPDRLPVELREHLPDKEDNYKIRIELLRPLYASLNAPIHLGFPYILGPTGSGKSSLVEQVAARLNWPVRRMNAHPRMEVGDMIGDFGLIPDGHGGSMTKFIDGPLTMSMREGSIFLLDEFDLLDPSTVAGLNTIIEGGSLTLPTGEVVRPHENFRFVVTANTRGNGDETGSYTGTQVQNMAALDRFSFIEVGYMPQEEELSLMKAEFSMLPDELLEDMVKMANRIRESYMEGGLSAPMSTRVLRRWAYYYISLDRVNIESRLPTSLMHVYALRLSVPEQEAVHALGEGIFTERYYKV